MDQSRSDALPLQGLLGLKSTQTGIPERDELERWWVEGMNRETAWQRSHSSPPVDGRTQKTDWTFPIPGMAWVRSWILFRIAIIVQGIAARAALGQASSADARADSSAIFDFFGKGAWELKLAAEQDDPDFTSAQGAKAKL